jgi:hypothetical protein
LNLHPVKDIRLDSGAPEPETVTAAVIDSFVLFIGVHSSFLLYQMLPLIYSRAWFNETLIEGILLN